MRQLVVLASSLTALFLAYGASDLSRDHLSTATAGILVLTATFFILDFAREYHWMKTPMGRSLMVLAGGVLLLSAQGLAYQILGPHYWGREWIVIVGRSLVIAALFQRIFALRKARREDVSWTHLPATTDA